MGKSQPSSKSKPDHRRDRVQRVNSKRAAAEPADDLGAKAARWKAAHIAEARAKTENAKARGEVKDALIASGVQHAVTPVGTIALQERAGSTSIDWEALARAHVTPEVIEQVLPQFTTVGDPSVVLAAPKEWGVEAKAAA